MSIAFTIDNFGPNNIKELSRLTAEVQAGDTTLTPENIQGYGNGDFLLISRPGKEICELRTVTIAGTQITVDPLSFKHQKYAQLTSIRGDLIRVYRAANVNGYAPADASFAQVGSDVTIEVDQLSTPFSDPDGSSSFWYKFTYANSVSSSETPLADSVAVRGGGYGNYATIDQIKHTAGFGSNVNITASMIDEKRVAAEGEINSALGGMYTVPFAEPVPAMITNIAQLLAAGFLLQDQVNSFSNGAARGDAKVKEARDMLMQIQDGSKTMQDATGTSLKASQGVVMYPANSTDGGGFLFGREDIY